VTDEHELYCLRKIDRVCRAFDPVRCVFLSNGLDGSLSIGVVSPGVKSLTDDSVSVRRSFGRIRALEIADRQ